MDAMGYLPCFGKYKHKKYPISVLYRNSTFVNKTKYFLGILIECNSPLALRQAGVGKEIKTLRPGDSAEVDRVLKELEYPDTDVQRIDYGDNKLRIYFGFSNTYRLAYIYAIECDHRNFKK